MAANKIIKGRDLMLFDNDGHSYAYATNHTLTITAETIDVSSKDHGVWGGMSEDERRAMKRRASRARLRTS